MAPMPPELKSHRFRAEREADWQRLERILDLFDRGQIARLSDDEAIAIPVLYRSALSALSTARAISLDHNLIAYLESLSTRAYFCVYGTRTTARDWIANFLAHGWRAAVRAVRTETVAAAAFGILGAIVAFALVRADQQWFYAFVSQPLAQGRDPAASTEALRTILFGGHGGTGLAFFTSFLFTHNAQIAILAFALGIACGLPTAFLLFYNGLTVGAFLALYAGHGLAFDFGGWLLIHGVTELFAVTLAGAAGFRIGWALAFPGERSRLDAIRAAGREAALVMAGVVIMLMVAGLLEGFARQMIASTPARYAVAVATAAFWLTFFYAGRLRR